MPIRLTPLTAYMPAVVVAIIAVLAPIHDAMITCGILIVMDLIMGIVASRKLGEKIESKKLKNTVVKMLVYQLLIISAFISEKYMVDFLPLTKITLAFVAIVEFSSLAENFQKITGLPFVKYIAKYINNMLNKEDLPKIDEDGEDK
jgi:phage-related holin